MTDVTDFRLLGHGLEMARAAQATLCLDADAVPLMRQTEALLQAGHLTGASQRNWDSYGAEVVLPEPPATADRILLTDPQTSGGLLIACAAGEADCLLAQIRAAGYAQAAIIGEIATGNRARSLRGAAPDRSAVLPHHATHRGLTGTRVQRRFRAWCRKSRICWGKRS